jgi:hypothetical protein
MTKTARIRVVMSLVLTLMALWPPSLPSGGMLGGTLASACGWNFTGIGLQGTYVQCVTDCSQDAYTWTTDRCLPTLPTGTDWVCYVVLAFWEAGCVLVCPFIP